MEQGSRVDQIENRCDSIQEEQSQQFSDIQDNLASIWNHLDPHPPYPPPPPYDSFNPPPPFPPYTPGETPFRPTFY